jgi:hypothetical protein
VRCEMLPNLVRAAARRVRADAREALVVAVVVAAVVSLVIVTVGTASQAKTAPPPREVLPLAAGSAWFSETLNTSAPTVATGRRTFQAEIVRKWVTWQRQEFIQDIPVAGRALPGIYAVGDSEPGFGDWDALTVHTLPTTAVRIRKLLSSGRLEAGQDRVEAPAAREAAFTVIEHLPGLQPLGTVRDAQGRTGTAVAEQAGNLHPLLIATGPGCASPYGGAGCVGVAKPAGRYQVEVIFDPSRHTVLGVRTTAIAAIPRARIAAGTAIYEASYLAGRVVAHPAIPPAPRAVPPSWQSVPWQLARVSGRRVTVHWQSGTCDPSLPPRPHIKIAQTNGAVTLAVVIHVVTATGGELCAGVGLGGTLSVTLARPLGDRPLSHAHVTDHDR